MAELEFNELVVLNTLLGYNLKFTEEKNVADLINEIEKDHDSRITEMSLEESEEFVEAAKACIERNEEFGNYQVIDSVNRIKDSNGHDTIAPIVTFANGDDAVVVFWGTTGADEWYDNVIAGHESVEGSYFQNKALNYINEISKSYDNITVTGHSKGGNKAQYVTLMSDKVDRCVAIDGQGFSKAFITEHAELINAKKDLITVISSDHDIVNMLIYRIAGTVLFVDSSELPSEYVEKNFMHYHKPSILLKKDGYLYNYEGVEPSKVSVFVKDISEYMTSIEDVEVREKVFLFMAEIVKMGLGPGHDIDGIKNKFLDIESTEAVAILLAYIFEYAESNNLTYDDVAAMLKEVGVKSNIVDAWFIPILWDALFDASREISENEFIELCTAIADWSKQNGINTWGGFLVYIIKDPFRLISLYASLGVDRETVHKAIEKFFSPENMAALLAGFATEHPIITGAAGKVISSPAIQGQIRVLSEIVTISGMIYLTENHIIQNWNKICNTVGKAIDYVMDEIAKFYSEVKERLQNGINIFVGNVFEEAEFLLTKASEAISPIVDGAVNFLEFVKVQTVIEVKNLMFISNPILYTIASKIYRETKQPVIINVTKLRSSVEALNRLANRVVNMDSRLDNLYSLLSRNNIEQEEGIFTSLANLYNLLRADLNVDQGAIIKQKAKALSELFEGYEIAERTINSKVPNRL